MPNRYKAFNRYVLAVLLFAIAAFTAFRGLRAGQETSVTEGRIEWVRTERRVEYWSRSSSEAGGLRRRWHSVDWSVYLYEVKGTQYRNEALGSRPIGEAVTVYCDPDNPRRSTLENPGSPVVFFVLTLLCLAGGMVFVNEARKLLKPRPWASKPHAASWAPEALVACVDVDYRERVAVAAGVWFRGWGTSEVETEVVTTLDEVAPYQPGEFYRRELPCVLAVLERGPAPEVVVVDGYVWLGPERPGLGAHLYQALGERTVVVGVAKSPFAGATDAVPVCRGDSQSPLYVTAAGVSAEKAAGWVASMHGSHRIPGLLKRVDELARGRQHVRNMP